MTNATNKPTLSDIAAQLTDIKHGQVEIKQQLDRLELKFGFLETRFDSIDKRKLWGCGFPPQRFVSQRFTNWDNRLADLSMRQRQVNSTAFFGVGIALLSAAIAFVVARVSRGDL